MEKKKVVILCIAIALCACFVSGLFMFYYMSSKERGNEIKLGTGNYDDIAKYMEISDLEALINEFYYLEAPEENLVTGAMKGMVTALGDPYSTYYTEEEFNNYTASSEGLLVGVGLSAEPVSKENGYLRVRRVYNGSPAQEAGIVQGSIIMAVDGMNIATLDYESAIDLISGPSGSTVVLTVAEGSNAAVDIPLTRTDVQVPSVSYNSLDEDVGLITIFDFGASSSAEFEKALTALLEEEEVKGVVIDLRGNIRGTVKGAVDILDQIMPQGLLTYSQASGEDRIEYVADSNYNPIPLAVVVNGASASGAEVFAGAVQAAGRGMVVGEKTYGKGVLQTVQAMPYSGGGVKLTTAEYYTPKDQKINILGITPDEIVEMPVDGSGLALDKDPQIRAALNAVHAAITAG